VQNVRSEQDVTVFGFDGGEKLFPLGEYPRSASDSEVTLTRELTQSDPSRNLNGAIPKAVQELDARLMRVKRPVRVGTLVVFTQGPDVAGRKTLEALQDELDSVQHDRFAIGLQSEDTYYLESIGDDGTVLAQNEDEYGVAFQEAAAKVGNALRRHYLVQYCSPARAGVRTLRLEVRHISKEGEERSGDLALDFDASRFGPGCDPKSTPKFAVSAKGPGELPQDAPLGEGPGTPSQGQPGVAPTPAGREDPDEEEESFVPPPDKPGYE
jgi:hypothetical protein